MSSCENLTTPEMENFKIEIKDDRTNKDRFKDALENELETESVSTKLTKISNFFGEFCETDPKDLSVRLIDGGFGEGTIKGNVVEIQTPNTRDLVNQTTADLGYLMKNSTEEEKEEISKQLILAVTASTILHEATHGLLNSRPGSKFATEMEETAEIDNAEGKISTLLDEGITYAIQEVFAPEIKLIGSVAPRINKDDREIVKIRKELGHKLKPMVETYLNLGKSMNRDFITKSSQELKEVLINRHI
jgi:hypothetical protein